MIFKAPGLENESIDILCTWFRFRRNHLHWGSQSRAWLQMSPWCRRHNIYMQISFHNVQRKRAWTPSLRSVLSPTCPEERLLFEFWKLPLTDIYGKKFKFHSKSVRDTGLPCFARMLSTSRLSLDHKYTNHSARCRNCSRLLYLPSNVFARIGTLTLHISTRRSFVHLQHAIIICDLHRGHATCTRCWKAKSLQRSWSRPPLCTAFSHIHASSSQRYEVDFQNSRAFDSTPLKSFWRCLWYTFQQGFIQQYFVQFQRPSSSLLPFNQGTRISSCRLHAVQGNVSLLHVTEYVP